MKTLSIVIPVYNEEKRLAKTFEALRELRLPRGLKLEKVIFVNDGSTDNTLTRIKNYESRIKEKTYNLQRITYKQNKGKGYAIARGMKASDSDYTLICDADMSTPLDQIDRLAPYMEQSVPIIIGTRKNGHSTVIRHQPLYRELLGRGFTLLSQVILNIWVTDFTCGFKAFSREAKVSIVALRRINHWGFDPELLFLGRLLKYDMVEIPVVWSDDRRSKVNLFKDLPRSLCELFLIRWYHFVGLYGTSVLPAPARLSAQLIASIKTLLV